MGLYHLYRKIASKRRIQMKQMSRMKKNVIAVVSKAMVFVVKISSIFPVSLCVNIFVQPSLNADFLFFMFSRNRRTKRPFSVLFSH
jgi:isocitrate dehydrogenase kinase/phosphatase